MFPDGPEVGFRRVRPDTHLFSKQKYVLFLLTARCDLVGSTALSFMSLSLFPPEEDGSPSMLSPRELNVLFREVGETDFGAPSSRLCRKKKSLVDLHHVGIFFNQIVSSLL